MFEEQLTLTFPQNGGKHEFRWVFMPYCIMPLGPNEWVVLNRAYKPLGMNTREHLDYRPFATKMHLRRGSVSHLDWRGEARLTENEQAWPQPIFLYNDGCVPTRSAEHMKAYMDRVSHLMEMKVGNVE